MLRCGACRSAAALRRRSPARVSRSCPRAGGSTPNLTVEENLRLGFAGRRSRDGHSTRTSPGYTSSSRSSPSSRGRQAGTLSGGQQQQLAIARALVARPDVLLLDEPSLGLAPQVVDTVFEALAEIRERGVTILLVEQRAQRTVAFADRTYVLANGELVTTLGAEGRRRHRAADRRVPRPRADEHAPGPDRRDCALGAVYALMAVGIGLVFGVLRLVNFAYGQLIMAGAYTLALTNGWNPVASDPHVLRRRDRADDG